MNGAETTTNPPGTNQAGNGNGNVQRYRLDEVERRLCVLEGKVDSISATLTRIEEKLQNVAPKEYLWKFFGVTVLILFLTLGLHILLRSFSG